MNQLLKMYKKVVKAILRDGSAVYRLQNENLSIIMMHLINFPLNQIDFFFSNRHQSNLIQSDLISIFPIETMTSHQNNNKNHNHHQFSINHHTIEAGREFRKANLTRPHSARIADFRYSSLNFSTSDGSECTRLHAVYSTFAAFFSCRMRFETEWEM